VDPSKCVTKQYSLCTSNEDSTSFPKQDWHSWSLQLGNEVLENCGNLNLYIDTTEYYIVLLCEIIYKRYVQDIFLYVGMECSLDIQMSANVGHCQVERWHGTLLVASTGVYMLPYWDWCLYYVLNKHDV